MAISKKGSRTIIVDGRRFRWHVRRRPSYSQALAQSPLSFAVELADQPAQVLHVNLDAARPDAWLTAEPVTLSPGMVTAIIRHAIQNGWTPDIPGPTFATSARIDRQNARDDCTASDITLLPSLTWVVLPSIRRG